MESQLERSFRLTEIAKVLEKTDSSRARGLYVEAAECLFQVLKESGRSDQVKAQVKQHLQWTIAQAESIDAGSKDSTTISDSSSEVSEWDEPFSSVSYDELIEMAIGQDEIGNFEDAMSLYGQAAKSILDVLEKENVSDKIRSRLESKVQMILERRAFLKKQTTRKSSTGSIVHSHKLQRKSDFSAEELAVLRKSSVFGGKTFYPWIDSDKFDVFRYKSPFFDKDGLLPLSKLQSFHFDSWLRPFQILERRGIIGVVPKVIVLISPASVKQTIVTDCSFVSALSVAAHYENMLKRPLISGIIFPQGKDGKPVYNPSGKYVVKLHINGVLRKVVIDDRLPVDRHGNTLCSFSNVNGELWVSLLEKAFLKAMGGYQFPGSNGGIDLHYLTGWIPERVSCRDLLETEAQCIRIWDRISSGHRYGDCLLTCGTGFMRAEDEKNCGLVSSHAYAILRVEHINGNKLLLLKNPWACRSWTGKFSSTDAISWTKDLTKALNYDPASASRLDNGLFWIDWDSLLNHFDSLYINWNPELFQHLSTIHSMWSKDIGPIEDRIDMGMNPQYRLELSSADTVWVLLSKHLTTVKELDPDDFITVHVYSKSSGDRIFYPHDAMISGTYMNSPHYLVKIDVTDPESLLTLVVSQVKKTHDLYFTLQVFSTYSHSLSEIPRPQVSCKVSGSWSPSNSGGPTSSPSYFFNPQFLLKVSEPCNLIVQLKSAPPAAVHVIMFPYSGHRIQSFESIPVGDAGNYRDSFSYIETSECLPGSYVLIVSTYLPEQYVPFILTLLTDSGTPLSLVEL